MSAASSSNKKQETKSAHVKGKAAPKKPQVDRNIASMLRTLRMDRARMKRRGIPFEQHYYIVEHSIPRGDNGIRYGDILSHDEARQLVQATSSSDLDHLARGEVSYRIFGFNITRYDYGSSLFNGALKASGCLPAQADRYRSMIKDILDLHPALVDAST